MTPRLRCTLRRLRPLVVLTAAALPAYGTAVAYGGTPVRAASVRLSVTGHREELRSAEDTAREAAAARHSTDDRGHPEQGPPGRDGPAGAHAGPVPSAHQDAPAAVPRPSDSASASVHPYRRLASVEPSRAGSRAGEGRMRPGRPDGPATEVEGDDDPPLATPVAQPEDQEEQAEPEQAETAQIPSASSSPQEAGSAPAGRPEQPVRQAAPQGEAATEPVLRLLPLGSGLVLIGLGLGLALLGLRLRRN
ncbi:hypothetical protein [Streptomyces cyanogenus]|uniref:Secreted protein n=1 Tax=Streptomyces cyanogenus TaxID=80860 RepID=A0ABX7TWD3_STRCY|nr:hypothetical protein [Streptomyces cyanogenus]QTD99751.1 hypothetical protein S1361_20615 [Streptomyces cyanogenus]